ncbi:MAG: hypothetical protein IPP47_18525 [Bryobacterales bacterium]|nr:hypothetical protein [Bryobacterales bacterium]
MPDQPGPQTAGLPVPPHFLLALLLLTALTAALVNPGNMGSLDPSRRLQQAHSWWTDEPEVGPEPYNQIWGAPDRQGLKRATFGMGHPLILLPADLAASGMIRIARLAYPLDPPTAKLLRHVLVAFLSQTFIGWAALVFAYLLLRALAFSHGIATLGTLSLLFATTFLHYLQICQENNLMLALSLAGLFGVARWLDTGAGRYAALAGAAFGYSLLVRPTTLGDAGGAFVFLVLALWWGPRRPLVSLASLAWFLPPFLAGGMAERGYQFLRFGVWTGTYYTTSGSGVQDLFPPRPPGTGYGSSLWFPQNSIFLFDPLLPLLLILLAVFWTATAPKVKAVALGALATLAVYIVFHAGYLSPTGEHSWGSRYVQTPVHILCLLAVPLLCTHWKAISRLVRIAAVLLIAWSVIQQIASLLLIMSLEVHYVDHRHSDWSILRRFYHLWLVFSGAADTHWWLSRFPPEWRRLSLLPAQLGLRYPLLSHIATGAWFLILAALLMHARRILHQAIGGPPLARLAEVLRTPRPVHLDGRPGA